MSIQIKTENGKIVCKFWSPDSFTDIVATLKQHRCRFSPESKSWTIPHQKYDRVLEDLQEFDIVDTSLFDEQQIYNITAGQPELKISTTRMLFDNKLLKHPPRLGKTPFEHYQQEDITKAFNRNRYALYWEVGTGKAYAKAAIIAHLRAHGKAKKVLLLSSGIGSINMVHELKKFLPLNENEIVAVTKAGKDREPFKKDASIVVTNYNTFRIICEHYEKLKFPKKIAKRKEELKKAKEEGKKAPKKSATKPEVLPLLEWFDGEDAILLMDECHLISNPDAEQTKWMLAHCDRFEYRYQFSGTPFDKNEKLYAQLRILDPSLTLRLSFSDWKEHYAILGTEFSQYGIRTWKYDKIKELNEKVRKGYGGIIRKASEVLAIPPNHIKKMYVDLSPLQKSIYRAFTISTLERLQENKKALLTRDIINTFPFLQMAIDQPQELLVKHPDLLSPELTRMIKEFDYEEDHAKIDLTDEIVKEHVDEKDEKGILWYWHPATAHALMKKYAKYKPLMILAETPDDERAKILELFRTSKEHKLLLGSILILNTSITLVEAKFQVYLERVYNYSQFTQSMGRISRIGQDQETQTYIPIADNTIDCALDVNLSTKDLLNNKLLSKDFLTLDEWKRIFNYSEEDAFEDFGSQALLTA